MWLLERKLGRKILKTEKQYLGKKKKNLLYIYFGSESNKIEWSNQNVIVRSFWATHKKIKK